MAAKTALSARNLSVSDADLSAIQAAYDRGAFRKALYRAKKVLTILPEHVALNALAGVSAKALGHVAEAEAFFGKAIASEGPGSAWQSPLGELLLEQERADAAIDCFAARLKQAGGDARACNGLGLALLATGQFQQALTILSEAVRLDPSNAQYLGNLGQVFESSGMIGQARQCFTLACQLDPDIPRLHIQRARAEHYDGDANSALDTLSAAHRRWPKNAEIINAEAVVLSALGRRDAAREKYRAAIRAEPDNYVPYANFANNFVMDDEPEIEAAVQRMLASTGAAAGGAARHRSLQFTLTKIHEDKGNYATAHAALVQANRLRKAELGYDIARDARMFDALKVEWAELNSHDVTATASRQIPIFIVGLPRSGTTLCETILSRHDQVTGMGELDNLMHAARRCRPGAMGPEWPTALRRDYLSSLPDSASQTRFFTDKMPLNFRFIGQIATAFPEARIVHVVRDARATGWSIYRTFFSSAGNGFAYDPADVVAYYRLYRDLMEFWHRRFPGRIVTLDYDALTDDQDGQSRAFLDQLGLDWDPKCLSPEKADHAVLTASSQQVRRKIYAGSSQGWRRYEPFAGEWLNRLGQGP